MSPQISRPPDRITDPVSGSGLVNLPNALTMLRLVLVVPFAIALTWQDGTNPTSRVVATVLFVVASVTDFVDGYLARKRNLVTTFGKIADPIADKLLTGVALIGLSALGQLAWWVTLVILGREVLVTQQGGDRRESGWEGQDGGADRGDRALPPAAVRLGGYCGHGDDGRGAAAHSGHRCRLRSACDPPASPTRMTSIARKE